MPPDLALLSTLIGSNYPCLELVFMVPKMFEPLKFDCSDGKALAFIVIFKSNYKVLEMFFTVVLSATN